MLALANARSLAESLVPTPAPTDWLGAFRDCATLAHVLQSHAERQPEKRLYTFLDERGREADFVTYRTFYDRVRSVAAEIQAVTRQGDRALLLFEPGPEYMVTFFACIAAGVVAVPAYPPEPHRPEWGLGRLNRIVSDAAPSVLLTSESVKSRLEVLLASQLTGLRVVAVDGKSTASERDFRPVSVAPTDAAFLQYTSGSTAEPRGVIVTHDNIMDNERMIAVGFGNTPQMVVVSWLPFYHDMGLIGNMLQPAFVGGQCIAMSPTTFLRQPLIWLQAISRYRATTSGAPNFGYEACIQRVRSDALDKLDLSSWRVAYCGSEPIRQSTLLRFADRFRSAGFDPKAFAPCYGLAEATLLVAVGQPQRGAHFTRFSREGLRAKLAVRDNDGVALASCGTSVGAEEISIVDPSTRAPLPRGGVGEIWVHGPNIGAGYFGENGQTGDTFDAVDATGKGPYLRTGDVGFIHEDQLYVADRLRDLIVLQGRQHYPHQLEYTVEGCDDALLPQACVAFAIAPSELAAFGVAAPPDSARPVAGTFGIAVELSGKTQRDLDTEQVFTNILRALDQQHGITPSFIAICKRGTLSRTSSGKLQRHLCGRDLLSERLQPQAVWRAAAL
jgi:acyl-CoA synthetase (AMP-forming)/AMP-acid ligase II